MAEFVYRTQGNADPKGKPRVYFTCHPADLERYFDKICEDIFLTQNCAIYYREDMTQIVAEEELETTLGCMSLFVVPVTAKLLTTENVAMHHELAYAAKEKIPILPFMMEAGLENLYSLAEVFGGRQYLRVFDQETTEILYTDKLKKYLQSVLISDEMAERVRAAFDAYIFLSYRKKDRRYAHELMRLIHRNKECRDIAIWYDEFLVPGESFRENINRMLDKSSLFALLVTPSLLEEPGGVPNFVMAEEYPRAKASGMDILPAEMDATDRAALREKFAGIPDCIDPRETKGLRDRLLESLLRFAKTANNDDPEHNFLIGLAYFEGIDVEMDRVRGERLIASAAEAGLPEAMEKLYDIFASSGRLGAEMWAERLVAYYEKNCGAEHEQTLLWRERLALRYGFGAYSNDRAKLEKALVLASSIYETRLKSLGEDHEKTLRALSNLAFCYGELGERREALRLEKIYYDKLLGRKDVPLSTAMHVAKNLAASYRDCGEYEKACELQEMVCAYYEGVLEEKTPGLLAARHDLAYLYGMTEKYEAAVALGERVHVAWCELYGEDSPKALASANNLGMAYVGLGDAPRAAELLERAYALASETPMGDPSLKETLFYTLKYASEVRPTATEKKSGLPDIDDFDLDLSDL